MSKWLESLRVGDDVAVIGRGEHLAGVESIGATVLVCRYRSGTKLTVSRQTGWEVGDFDGAPRHIAEPTPEVLSRIHQAHMRSWAKLVANGKILKLSPERISKVRDLVLQLEKEQANDA